MRCFFPKQRERGYTQRDWWRRKISLRSFGLHYSAFAVSTFVNNRRSNQLVYSTDRWCGFQVIYRIYIVIDPTVSWILFRVVPTVHRSHVFVSYFTTDRGGEYTRIVAVVVSQTNNIKPLLWGRRGHRFVSLIATVVVCISARLAVVVSLRVSRSSFALYSVLSLPPSRNSDPGSHSRLFSRSTNYGSCLAFFIARRFQLFLPSSTRVELCVPTLGALSSWS